MKIVKQQVILCLQRNIALIDQILNAQLNIILHNNRLQLLEASWRGIKYLVAQISEITEQKIKIRILNITWQLLAKDLSRAFEVDQSEMFFKIYSQEFGMAGGEPFGLIIGDYYIQNQLRGQSLVSDIAVLDLFAKISAASFVPFVVSASPKMFNISNFSKLDVLQNYADIFKQTTYSEWNKLRKKEDARFLGVVFPFVLQRLPYESLFSARGFCFVEETYKETDYLWGNAIYCFAAVVMQAFKSSGWLADIVGMQQDKKNGGLVTNVMRHYFSTDSTILAYKPLACVSITENQAKMFSDCGFIALSEYKCSKKSVFYDCASIKESTKCVYSSAGNIMLNYILCVSRFAHYIKVLVRNKIGLFISAIECERYLTKWLMQYTASGNELTPETKAKYPLREAKIIVKEYPGKSGSFLSYMYLQPQYQIEQQDTTLQLVAELII